MLKEYVVRVARLDLPEFDTPFVECLRYACLIEVPNDSDEVFDILCPRGLDSKTWAERNAARMQSFGYNAVVAPRWE